MPNSTFCNVPRLRFPGFEGEWEKVTLGEIGHIVGGGTPDTTNQDYWNGDIQWFTPSEIGKEKYVTTSERQITQMGLKNSSAKLLPTGSILLSSRATVGECSICLNECSTNQGFQSFIPKRKKVDEDFLFYLLLTHKKDFIRKACGSTFLEISAKQIGKIPTLIPKQEEQQKISRILSLLDQRISIQNKTIEDLKKLKSALCEQAYQSQENIDRPLSELIRQISDRNKGNFINRVLSVSNKLGFIEQSEQFEDRTIASEDTSNYKIVSPNDFAYNPARINVGSIARLKDVTCGIVSPMYICFRTAPSILPEYLEFFFNTRFFQTEVQKRLEGSVRLCLSFDGLCDISIPLPTIEIQKSIKNRLIAITRKIEMESRICELLQNQKTFLLNNLFV